MVIADPRGNETRRGSPVLTSSSGRPSLIWNRGAGRSALLRQAGESAGSRAARRYPRWDECATGTIAREKPVALTARLVA